MTDNVILPERHQHDRITRDTVQVADAAGVLTLLDHLEEGGSRETSL